MLIVPSAAIFNHLRVPTAASCALPAGNCSGTCMGTCSGLLGLCRLCTVSLTKSFWDKDFRMLATAKPGASLLLTCSVALFFLPARFLAVFPAPALLLLNFGCFLAALLLAVMPVFKVPLECLCISSTPMMDCRYGGPCSSYLCSPELQ